MLVGPKLASSAVLFTSVVPRYRLMSAPPLKPEPLTTITSPAIPEGGSIFVSVGGGFTVNTAVLVLVTFQTTSTL